MVTKFILIKYIHNFDTHFSILQGFNWCISPKLQPKLYFSLDFILLV